MQISLILNTPSTDVTGTLREAVRRLREAGHTVIPRLTFEEGDARAFARAGAETGAALVVAGGGDGTINEVVNGILDWADEAARGSGGALPRLGVIPLGTGNDLAGALNIPTDPEVALAAALAGNAVPLDVAVVNGRRFVNVSTGGFGAEATDETPDEVKRILGSLAYVITGVRKFVEMDVPSARFTCDGEVVYEGPFMVFAVGNSRRTGGGNWLTPRAELSDGLLDLCLVKQVSRVDFLTLAPQLRAGTHLEHPAVIYRKVKTLRVESEATLHVNADGEPLSGRRFDYALAPHRLELVVPDQVPPAPDGGGEEGAEER